MLVYFNGTTHNLECYLIDILLCDHPLSVTKWPQCLSGKIVYLFSVLPKVLTSIALYFCFRLDVNQASKRKNNLDFSSEKAKSIRQK